MSSSRLVSIIDAYKDQHGQPSDSSVARAIGIKPQTLSSWRQRGLKEPPDRDALRLLARLAGVNYEDHVLRAALLDAGWIEESDGDAQRYAPATKAPESEPGQQADTRKKSDFALAHRRGAPGKGPKGRKEQPPD